MEDWGIVRNEVSLPKRAARTNRLKQKAFSQRESVDWLQTVLHLNSIFGIFDVAQLPSFFCQRQQNVPTAMWCRFNNRFLHYLVLQQAITHLMCSGVGLCRCVEWELTAIEMDNFIDWQVGMSVSCKCLRTMKLYPCKWYSELHLFKTQKYGFLLPGLLQTSNDSFILRGLWND